MNKISRIPEIGSMLGDQLVLGAAEREEFPHGHRLAGRLKPQQIIVKCVCGGVRKIHFHSIREGVKRCRACYQAERRESKKMRLSKRKTPPTESLPEVAFVTGVLLAMARVAR